MNSLSKIIAGAMSWGDFGKALSKSEMKGLMHHCLDHNITTFDHADIYGGYTTEAAFGSAFAESGINRENVQLISKCGIQYLTENRTNKVKHYDYSTRYIIWSVEQSIKNLKTEYLDVLLLHRPSPLMNPEEIADAVHHLKQNGMIRHFGVSNFTASQMALIQKTVLVEFNQIEMSLTHFQPMLDGTLDYMMTHDIKPMAWSPLGSVFKQETEQTLRIKKVLAEMEMKYNATADQLLLAWLMKHPSGILPVVGTTNIYRLQKAMEALEISLDLQDWFVLLTESQGHKVP